MQNIEAKVAELVGPVLAGLPEAQRPAVVALAERIAAERYRGWADEVGDASARSRLLACAAREEEIAARVEASVPNAADVQAAASAAHPELPERYAALFTGLPLAEQFAMQAAAERAGAATWRALAEKAGPAQREVFETCAGLEEASAAVLDGLVAEGVGAA